jgi:hypothetical protein
MKILRSATAAIAFVSTLSGAQSTPTARPATADIVTLLQLDATRAGLIDAILDGALKRALTARAMIRPTDDSMSRLVMQAAMHAIREDTDRQLAAVLTAEELAAFKAAAAATVPLPIDPVGPRGLAM